MPSLIHVIEHHARDKKALIGYMCTLYCSILAPKGWTCDSKLGGANSFYWTSPDGKKELHFRNPGIPGAIEVKDSYQKGKRVILLRNERDCRKLVKMALA